MSDGPVTEDGTVIIEPGVIVEVPIPPDPNYCQDGDDSEDFCGCCGEVSDGTAEWCSRCLPHVEMSGRAPWLRTYFGWSGRDCPYQIRIVPTPPRSS